MNNVIIFAGTTEGRVLSGMLGKAGIGHTVCVATGYGADIMGEDPAVCVRAGRMDKEEMVRFFSKVKADADTIVADATHPYATEVTRNIKQAANEAGIRYIRIVRDGESACEDGISEYEDMMGCAESIDGTEGNILLTTGSKELGDYYDIVSKETAKRTFVRVLPSVESLTICEKLGIERSHIIAMQGPFDRKLNEAIIRQLDIRHLVTKDSGSAGGFEEKIEAARNTNTEVHMIARPNDEEGVSVCDAYRIIAGTDAKAPVDADARHLTITLVGIGMGDRGCLTFDAEHAINRADAVFGSKRLVKNIKCPRKYEMYLAGDIIPVIESENIRNAVILFSGDTGLKSGAKGMLTALRRWRKDVNIRVIPGISSFSYMAARLQESYDDAFLFSIHGRNAEKDMAYLAHNIRYHAKAFVLLSQAGDVQRLAQKLIEAEVEGHIAIGMDLSYKNEKISELTFEEALEYDDDGLAIAVIVNENPQKRPLINIKRDNEFIRDRVPMTKENIRHLSIIKLGLEEGDVFYDIGGGTGSVAIEAASLDPHLQVYTIEKDHDAADLIRKNINNAGLENITVIEGDAVSVLAGMQKPDRVFIGGSGGRLCDIADVLHSKGNGIRFVVNAVTVETTEEVRKVIRKYEPEDEEAVMISVCDEQAVGSYHMLKAQNPVWIFSFTI